MVTSRKICTFCSQKKKNGTTCPSVRYTCIDGSTIPFVKKYICIAADHICPVWHFISEIGNCSIQAWSNKTHHATKLLHNAPISVLFKLNSLSEAAPTLSLRSASHERCMINRIEQKEVVHYINTAQVIVQNSQMTCWKRSLHRAPLLTLLSVNCTLISWPSCPL